MDLVPLANLAMEQSLADAKLREEVLAKHKKKLEKILHVNGFKCKEVPQHGDCFF